MKTELVEVSPTKREIKLEVSQEVVKEAHQRITHKYARLAQVPGFRKGLAPVEIVKARFAEQIKGEVIRELLPERITEAIQHHNLNPLREPEIHLEHIEENPMNGSVPLSFHFHVEVMPEIPDLEYKGLEAVRRVRAVQDEEVEQVIEERLKSEAALVPIEDRKAETGDTIITDLSGVFLNEPSAEPIKADNIEITLGDERVEKAFTDNLLGVASEEVKSFRVDYPAEFTSPGLAGKSVEYTATIKTVGKIETPKADDEWAKSLEENFSGMKELRRKLRDDMEFIAKLEADNKVRDALVNALIDKNELEAPASLVDSQARNLANNFAQNMMQQGLDPKQAQQDFWQMVLQQMLPQAEREVRGALLLEKVGELEKVEATEEEINTEIENMANSARVTVQQVKQYLAGQGGEASIADRIRNRKSVEALFEHAKITDGEWIDEAAQAAEAAAAAGETGAAEEAKPEEKKPAKKTTAKPKAKKKEAE